jgi:hypothetical protein
VTEELCDIGTTAPGESEVKTSRSQRRDGHFPIIRKKRVRAMTSRAVTIPEEEVEFPLTVKAVMRLQHVNGCWKDISKYLKREGINIRVFEDLVHRKRVFESILAVAYLRSRFQREQNLWKLVEVKGLHWLHSVVQDLDVEVLIEQAMSLIP